MALVGPHLPETCSNYYELLGLRPFEADAAAIDARLRSLIREARKYQVGRYAIQVEKHLNLLAAVKNCLLDPAQKQRYDEELRQGFDLPPISVAASYPEGRETASGGAALSWSPWGYVALAATVVLAVVGLLARIVA